MTTPTLLEIIREHLEAMGADGLCNAEAEPVCPTCGGKKE